MDERQIRWGLSNGVTVLTVAGYFWGGLAIAAMSSRTSWPPLAALTAVQVMISAALIWRAVLLRRASGFSIADLRRGGAGLSAQTRRIRVAFRWTTLAQAVGVGIAVWLCISTGATDLIWPAIGLVVSLHFIPLARVFHMRAYYVVALVGTALSLAAVIGLGGANRQVWYGASMAAVMWLSSWYLLRNASEIAAVAARERWAG